jgi:hypothetical protein
MLECYSSIQDRQRKRHSGEALIQASAEGVCAPGDDGNLSHEQALRLSSLRRYGRRNGSVCDQNHIGRAPTCVGRSSRCERDHRALVSAVGGSRDCVVIASEAESSSGAHS